MCGHVAVWIAMLRHIATLVVAWISYGPRIEPGLMRNQPVNKPLDGQRGFEEGVKGCGASRRVLASGLGRIAQGD